jgi:cyclopropane-fatty-acyl-phospholipid synthase
MTGWAKRALLAGCRDLVDGSLRVECPGQIHQLGQPGPLDATLVVHDERFFRRALLGADIGIGESFMDGDWTTPDLVGLTRLMLRNRQLIDGNRWLGAAHSLAGRAARYWRDNSIAGSRRHIHRHYDLGNDFFQLFLDADLRMYSCAYYESASEPLETAQARKVDRICQALQLGPGDRVLEIGSGWGGFAAWAALRYGCHVTTTTISEEQYAYVRSWQARVGAAGRRVEVLKTDYRELDGQFDKIVSIEMFEAVGLPHYDDYFGTVDRLLTSDGAMLLQTITMTDQWFPQYRRRPDWIEKYIFPGGELASVGAILQALARTTSLSMYQAENFGTHYARTLQEWRRRFHAQRARVESLGFDERFIRMWDFYLASCEAAFLERHTGLFQLLLVKNGTRRRMHNEGGTVVEERDQRVASRESAASSLSRAVTSPSARVARPVREKCGSISARPSPRPEADRASCGAS